MPNLQSPPQNVPPIEECWATIDGARVRYQRAGCGAPLVLVHGLLGYSFSWRFNIPALAKYATVYAIDMLGAGFSDRCPGMDCSFRGSATRLLRFVRDMGISSFDLLGTSHGGAVAVLAAATANESCRAVRRLILVDPVNPYSAHGRILAPFLGGRVMSLLFRSLFPRLTLARSCLLRRLYADPRRISPGTLEGYSKPFAIPGSLEYGVDIARTWLHSLDDLESALPKIADIRTLLIWGSKDVAVDPASAQLLQRHFHNARLVMLDGVGHLPYEEAADDFNRAVIDFLANTPLPT
ncbi:MAG TPA: alpha/beta fold hydrolase [Terriglobales bacterium]|nr:alpha/beta fold hydrolase [Terriglobales bacterium]